MAGPAERLVWALDLVDVRPGGRVLEVGCGHGVAASLVCDMLEDGWLTAIDRSQKMVDLAARRNREHLDSGRAAFETMAFEKADFGGERFDRIFAVHVAAFWRDPAVLREAKRLLRPGGTIWLFNQAPGWKAIDMDAFAARLAGQMREAGMEPGIAMEPDLRVVGVSGRLPE